MTKNVKIGLMAFSIIGVGVGTYFLVQYIKLRNAYTTTLTPQQATNLIDQKTQNVDDTIIPDDISNNADANKGSEDIQDSSSSTLDSLNQYNLQSGMGDY